MRRVAGSIQDLGDGRFRVRVSAGRDPITRKRRRLSRVVTGKREAERVLSLLSLEAGKPPTADITLRAYLTGMWLPQLRVRPLTADGYRIKVEQQILPYIGDVALEELTPYVLDRWLARMSVAGVKAHTARHAYRVLRTALRQAVKWRLLPADPLAAVNAPKVEPYRPAMADADAAQAILDLFHGDKLEPIIIIALAAGLRRSELAALTWADVRFSTVEIAGEDGSPVKVETAEVSVTKGRHQRHGEVWLEAPKSHTSTRVVSLPGFAVRALKPLRGIGPIAGSLKPDGISKRYARILKDSDLPYVPLKNLRHSHATIALASGVDPIVVSRRLGHRSLAVTHDYYLRPGRAADDIAAAKIDAVMSWPTVAQVPSSPKTDAHG